MLIESLEKVSERLGDASKTSDASARSLVDATTGLVRTTSRLVFATWGLVGATLVLVAAEVLLKLSGH